MQPDHSESLKSKIEEFNSKLIFPIDFSVYQVSRTNIYSKPCSIRKWSSTPNRFLEQFEDGVLPEFNVRL